MASITGSKFISIKKYRENPIEKKKGEEIIRVSIEKIKYRIEINRKYSIVTMLQISNELESSSYATLSRDLVKTIPRFSYVYLDYYF